MGSKWDDGSSSPDDVEFWFSKRFLVLFLIMTLLLIVGVALSEEEAEPHSWNGGKHSVSTLVTPTLTNTRNG